MPRLGVGATLGEVPVERPMRLLRRIIVTVLLLLIGVGIWAAIYAQSRGFTRTWREMVESEFANRGVYVDIGKLTLGPFQGLVAEEVRFYQDPQRRKELASVDNVILDLDLSDILNRDLSINTLDVQDDNMVLPLDPGNRDSEVLELERFSARLVVTDNQIEVVRAQAMVAGIEVSMKGSLFRSVGEGEDGDSDDSGEDLTEEELLAQQKRQLLAIRRRLNRVEQVIAELEKFTFPGNDAPRLEVEFAGELDDLVHLYADVRFSAERFKRGTYAIESLQVSGQYQGDQERGVLKELHLRDSAGELRMRGDWPVADRVINFEVESTADLPALVAAFWPNPKLGEVVFFSSPKLQAEGQVNLWQLDKAEWPMLPFDLMGDFKTQRIASRGEVFDSVEGQFAIDGNRYYARNLRLDHKSGVALANLMFDPRHPQEVFRFQTEIRMDPAVVLPFLSSDLTKGFLTDWEFSDESAVYFAVLGGGASLDPKDWKTRGVIDLRNFHRLNVPFDQLESEYESEGAVHTYRNLRVVRPEGEVTAAMLRHDAAELTWQADELRSTMDLYAGIQAVAPSLGKALESFRFGQAPEVTLDGLIDSRRMGADEDAEGPDGEAASRAEAMAARHDFTLGFASDQPATFEFLGRPLPLERPRGVVEAKGGRLRLSEFSAGLFGGTVGATFETDRVESDRSYEATLSTDGVSSDDLLRLYGQAESQAGGTWTGEFALEGRFGEPGSIVAEGTAVLDGGQVLELLPFAGLKPFLQEKVDEADPVADAVEAPSRAEAGLKWKEKRLSLEGLEAEDRGWKIRGNGGFRPSTGEGDYRWRVWPPGDRQGPPLKVEGSGTPEAPNWKLVPPPTGAP